MKALLLVCCLALLVPVGCVSRSTSETKEPKKESALETLRKDIAEVAARDERKADEIQVQHLLVAHKDAGIGGVTRTKEEAEQLTAELYEKIRNGADFDALVKESTDDAHPGIYGMTMVGGGDRSRNVYARKGMVAAFGDVGWRLDVGEVGVAPFDSGTSPYGWHIIKRLK
ncbi:MAG: peptidylprolyl isomerase [Planctomycetes bacterium]|nr:peptidylprolyl isomerase [Planctomycetota bacterium]MCA8935592.1 peptidylprolyl isomerase [Planctomycetota bacterium]